MVDQIISQGKLDFFFTWESEPPISFDVLFSNVWPGFEIGTEQCTLLASYI